MSRQIRFSIVGLVLGFVLAEVAHSAWRWNIARHVHTAPIAEGLEAGRHAAFVERARADGIDLLFLGDSLTDWFKDTAAWFRFSGPRTANDGMMGDTCAGLLWRIEQGELDGLNPRVIVIEIGTNDLESETNSQIISGVRSIVAATRQRCSTSRLILLGILPRNDGGFERLARIRAINRELSATPDVRYLDLTPAIASSDGHLAPECAASDGLHLTPEGYRRWADAMEPMIGLGAARQSSIMPSSKQRGAND